MTYARRVDANQRAIVAAFERLGCRVLNLSAVGQGCPDLAVLIRGHVRLVEVKDGSKPPSARELTPPQKRFHAVWPVTRVMCVEDVLAMVGAK